MPSHDTQLPFVSVVVPAYNVEATINECLRHITMLNYPREKLEVIVVDDGSTDNTIEIVRKHQFRLVQKEHGGYPSTMNAGIKSTHGEIIVIVDSDTYLTERWLTNVVSEFGDPHVGIVSGYTVPASTESFWAKLAGYEAEDRLDKLRTKYVDHVTSTCTAYRRKLFDSIGFFDERLKRGSDGDLAHRAFRYGWKIVFRKDAKCYHDWRSSLKSYFKQQLREGKYAVALIHKAPELLLGKKLLSLSWYIPLVSTFLLFLTPIYALFNLLWFSFLLSAILIFYHIPSTVRIVSKHQDWTMLLLPIAINVRYVAWLIGLVAGAVIAVLHR